MAAPIILVIDPHRVYRHGLRSVIESNIDQSRVVEAAAITEIDESIRYDLILIDSAAMSPDCIVHLNHNRERYAMTRIAMMSVSNTRADVLNCLSAGFHGFVYKLQADQETVTAVRDLLSGRIYVPRWLAESADDRAARPPSVTTQAQQLNLTPRQREIMPLLAQGMSTKEIARTLRIAEGTTKIHTAALLRALGARNRTEAAFLSAKALGLSSRAGARSSDQFSLVSQGRIRA
jgi:DNA-binding NarL/FixJ family response regulator